MNPRPPPSPLNDKRCCFQVRGISKKAGLMCVLQTVLSRGLILPLPVVVLPAVFVDLLEGRGLMPSSPRGRLWVQVRESANACFIFLCVCFFFALCRSCQPWCESVFLPSDRRTSFSRKKRSSSQHLLDGGTRTLLHSLKESPLIELYIHNISSQLHTTVGVRNRSQSSNA